MDHLAKVDAVLQTLDEAHVGLNPKKCQFAVNAINWLGYDIFQSGIRPMAHKQHNITTAPPPKNPKTLKSFLGSINQLQRFIPNMAQISDPLRALLRKNQKIIWTETHAAAYNKLMSAIQSITEFRHFSTHRKSRIVCDASHKGIAAALEQLHPDGWRPVVYASRFFNQAELRYSTNELEMLAIVWACEHFRNNLFGYQFDIYTDHQALLSVLKNNRGNKTYFSRLTRWVDKLLPFEFTINHIPGSKMGLVDYLSRNPILQAERISKYDEDFLVYKISVVRSLLQPTARSKHRPPRLTQPANHNRAFALRHMTKRTPLSSFSPRSSSSTINSLRTCAVAMSTNPALIELSSDSDTDNSPPAITMPAKPQARPSPLFPKCISGTSGIKVRLPQLFDRKFLPDATTQDPILAAVRDKLEKNHRDDLKFVHPPLLLLTL